MRHPILLAVLAITSTITLQLTPAHATRCLYPERSITGPARASMPAARKAAIGAWQAAAQKKAGKRFSDWGYSGDRSLDCRWNKAGTVFQCRASAVPCGE